MNHVEQLEHHEIPARVRAISLQLVARRWLMCTAESCTGGLIAAACTDLAGSSDWFERGIVSYSNAAKCELLGVPADTIAAHGAVSSAVAEAMARGALSHSHAQVALAVTGVAGPSGGSVDKPVGTVRLGLARRGLDREATLRRRPPRGAGAVRRPRLARTRPGAAAGLSPIACRNGKGRQSRPFIRCIDRPQPAPRRTDLGLRVRPCLQSLRLQRSDPDGRPVRQTPSARCRRRGNPSSGCGCSRPDEPRNAGPARRTA